MHVEVIVVGGGTVGAAIAYGLARRRVSVLMLDGQDQDFRAANANFGLVWQHGKGLGMPAYLQLTRASVDLWADFGAELEDLTGIDLQFEHRGGLAICLGEDELEQRRTDLLRLHNQTVPADADWEMLTRAETAALLPGVELGAQVSGASLGRRDGHLNPLRLLHALRKGIHHHGGRIHGNSTVQAIERSGNGYIVHSAETSVSADRIVLAAGLGTKPLAAQAGLDIPIRPQRGQILVTERVAPFLALPTLSVRQTGEGTIMIGATNEEVGFDKSTTPAAASALSADAVRRFPALARARLVRQWSGLRIMTPDGHPIYAQSEVWPGVFVAQCHSGVTLAAIHADLLAEAAATGTMPSSLEPFHHRRFDVPQTV